MSASNPDQSQRITSKTDVFQAALMHFESAYAGKLDDLAAIIGVERPTISDALIKRKASGRTRSALIKRYLEETGSKSDRTSMEIALLTVELDACVRVSIPVFGPEGLAAAEAILNRVLAKCVAVKPTQTVVAGPESDIEKALIDKGLAGEVPPEVVPVPQRPASAA